MNRALRSSLLVAALGIPGWSVMGQTGAPSIRTSLDTSVIHVGDRIHLTVDVAHAEGQRVSWPDSLMLDPFEVIDARVGQPTQTATGMTSSLVLTLTAFELGDLELPSFDVVVAGDTLSTDGWVVTVASVGLDEGGEIRDVKGPMSMARNWWLVLPWVLGMLVLGALAVWLYRRHRRRDRPGAPAFPAPSRPPHEIALEALGALERSGLLERGEYKEYHIRVSDIFREYVEARFGIDALELVTDEVIARMSVRGLDREIVDGARGFLETCDLVKFAKHVPAPEASREITSTARTLIESTRPPAMPIEAGVA